MEVPISVLNKLLCDNCDGYLSRGPVLLLDDGKSVCGRCLEPEEGVATRNTPYEEVAKLLTFPCKYAEYGCQDKVPFEENKLHEEACEYRAYLCPIAESGKCDWTGLRASLLGHCKAEHPNNVIHNSHKFTHNISKASLQNFLLAAFNVLFLVQTKVCTTSRNIYHSVRLIGDPSRASMYEYDLVIENKKSKFIKQRAVAPQGCLALQEDTSIRTGLSNLSGVSGDFQGTTFTLRVRKTDEGRKEAMMSRFSAQLTCVKCGQITDPIYQDEEGWHCQTCAPMRRQCRFSAKGCGYSDIGKKCGKHELYFCSYIMRCVICKKNIVRTALDLHYTEAHKNITHRAGSEWSCVINDDEQWAIINGDFGNALCQFWKNGTRFNLNARIALPSEELYKYRCSARISHPEKGNVLSRSPEVQYNSINDWDIRIPDDELRACVYKNRCNIKIDFIKEDEI